MTPSRIASSTTYKTNITHLAVIMLMPIGSVAVEVVMVVRYSLLVQKSLRSSDCTPVLSFNVEPGHDTL